MNYTNISTKFYLNDGDYYLNIRRSKLIGTSALNKFIWTYIAAIDDKVAFSEDLEIIHYPEIYNIIRKFKND